MNNKTVWSLLAIVASVIGLGVVFHRPEYIPHTDTLTFERVVDNDEGRQLVSADLVSTEGAKLTDVFVPSTSAFTPERRSRYGADRTQTGGVGLKVTFVTKDGVKTTTEEFILPGWTAFERPTTRPQRRKEVEDAQPRLAKTITNFVAPISIKRVFGVALDTTEGVTSDLAKRVRQIVAKTRTQKLGSDAKNSVMLNLYNITESAYQGGRQQPDLTNNSEFESSLDWLVTKRPPKSQSSVLRGLVAILQEMSEYRESHPTLHIITDGLENLSELSVYKHPELLDDEAGWSKLDQIADLGALKLRGLDIHLHPLPDSSPAMMEKGLAYLASRLTKAGASVKIEPF